MGTAERVETPGSRLRDLRVEKGLTQVILAVQAGVTPGTISFAELDKRHPQLLIQVRIARVLGVDRRQIWPEDPPREAAS